MDDQSVNGSGYTEPSFAEIDAATRRLMAALPAADAMQLLRRVDAVLEGTRTQRLKALIG